MPRAPESKVLQNDAQVAAAVRALREAGRRIVTTNGCFDVLHWGHIHYLHLARERGDTLIVCINDDASVKRLKGAKRPVHALSARLLQIAGLESVDYVTWFAEDTPVRILERIAPNVHVKGGDYRADDLPETKAVRAHGGNVEIIPLAEGFSTTAILERQRS